MKNQLDVIQKIQELGKQVATLEKRQKDNTAELKLLEEQIVSYKEINTEEISKNLTLLNEKLAECDTKIQELGKQVATLETKK